MQRVLLFARELATATRRERLLAQRQAAATRGASTLGLGTDPLVTAADALLAKVAQGEALLRGLEGEALARALAGFDLAVVAAAAKQLEARVAARREGTQPLGGPARTGSLPAAPRPGGGDQLSLGSRPGAHPPATGRPGTTGPLAGKAAGSTGPLPGQRPATGSLPGAPAGQRPATGPLPGQRPGGTAAAAPKGLFDRLKSWADPTPAEAAAPPPPPPDPARQAFDAAVGFVKEVLAYVSPRLLLVRTAYDTTGLPAHAKPWSVVGRAVPTAVQAAGIGAAEAPWVGHLAKVFIDDQRAAREAHVALVRWDQARAADERARGVLAEPTRLAGFDTAAYRAAIFPLSHLHVAFRGLPHLGALFPPPADAAPATRLRATG